jgi:hypothetical protein
MKTKLLAVMAILGMVASASAVKVNNNLSINGFIDGSYYSSDQGATESSNIGVDEVELNFLVNAGNVSGELHIDSDRDADLDGSSDGNNNDLNIEQVHFSYSFGNGASIQVGRFGSALGLEREDPAGLYTYSRAYGNIAAGTTSAADLGYNNSFNIGNVDSNVFEGGRVSFASGDFTGSLALFNQVGATLENSTTNTENDLDVELAVSYSGIDNLSVTVGYINIATQDSTVAGAAANEDFNVYTVNASYTINKLLLAGEYSSAEGDDGDDLSAYLILADYDINEKIGIAVRYSEWDQTNTTSADKITFAPNYAITDSLGAIIEFSTTEADGVAVDVDEVAIELTYTF